MPIYIPRRATFSPPMNFEMEPENDNDYLLDPDQLWDRLPQPYRMINKIITQVLDTVWDIVKKKEDDVLQEAQNLPPPSYDQHNILQAFETVTSMASTNSGECLFLGLPDGLAVIDAESLEVIDKWNDPSAEIVSIQLCGIGENVILALTIDNLGTCRIFVYAVRCLFLVKPVNENAPQADVKILCHKCEMSQDGGFIGLVLENSNTHEVQLELYKCPLENWMAEIEQKAKLIHEPEVDNEVELETNEKSDSQENIVEPEMEIHSADNTSAKKSIKVSLEKLSQTPLVFATPEMIAKLKPPTPLAAAANVLLPPSTSAKGGDPADYLGLGLNHILNASHLSRRETMFKHRNENLIKYLPAEKPDITNLPTVHFLPASRLLPVDLEPGPSEKGQVSLALWWSGHSSVVHHSLSKTSKDLDWKPDLIWPYTSNITCSAVSHCGTHIAFGLADGSTIIWDWKLGLCKSVLKGPDKNFVKSLRFLDPSLYPLDQPSYPPYKTISATYLLAEYSKGSQLLFDTWHGSHQIPQKLAVEPENDDREQTVLKILPQASQLMFLVEKSGKMYFKDITNGSLVCQIELPPPFTLQNPWDPIFAFTDNGHTLFVKAEGTLVTDEGHSEMTTRVFGFHLLSFPGLSHYFDGTQPQETPLTVFNTMEQRIASLQVHRDQLMAERKANWTNQWTELPAMLTSVQSGAHTQCCTELLSVSLHRCCCSHRDTCLQSHTLHQMHDSGHKHHMHFCCSHKH